MCATTGTFDNDFTFCTSLPAALCQRQSGISAGFSTTSSAPAAIASAREYVPSLSKNELRNNTGVGWRAMMRRVASIPSMPGIIKSIMTRSGRSVAVSSTASAPVDAWPMTRISGSELSSADNTSRVTAESSTTSTRTKGVTFVCVGASDMHILLRPTPDEASNRVEQLALIEFALQHVCVCAHLETTAAIVDGVARCDNDDRDAAKLLVSPNALGQLETGHPRHIDVSDDQIPFLLVQALERLDAVARNLRLVSCRKQD